MQHSTCFTVHYTLLVILAILYYILYYTIYFTLYSNKCNKCSTLLFYISYCSASWFPQCSESVLENAAPTIHRVPTSWSGTELYPSYQSVCDGTQNVERYRYRYFFRYQIFLIPIPVLFPVPNFFWYRFRDFFPVPNFSDTGSETFFQYQYFPIPVPIPPKKWKIPGTGNSRYRYVTLW